MGEILHMCVARATTDQWPAVLGAEGPGLTPAVLERATRRVKIPISSKVDSLNVGHAAAITLAAVSRN